MDSKINRMTKSIISRMTKNNISSMTKTYLQQDDKKILSAVKHKSIISRTKIEFKVQIHCLTLAKAASMTLQ